MFIANTCTSKKPSLSCIIIDCHTRIGNVWTSLCRVINETRLPLKWKGWLKPTNSNREMVDKEARRDNAYCVGIDCFSLI